MKFLLNNALETAAVAFLAGSCVHWAFLGTWSGSDVESSSYNAQVSTLALEVERDEAPTSLALGMPASPFSLDSFGRVVAR